MWQVHDQTPALVAVVFGKVVEGMAVVKRIEAAGSKSGRTAQRVVIASCGELASRRKIMAQLEAVKVSLSCATSSSRARLLLHEHTRSNTAYGWAPARTC